MKTSPLNQIVIVRKTNKGLYVLRQRSRAKLNLRLLSHNWKRLSIKKQKKLKNKKLKNKKSEVPTLASRKNGVVLNSGFPTADCRKPITNLVHLFYWRQDL